ncbi:hypothetical protein AB1N83_013852 [Pleurotus pulmonarius]
MSERGSMVWRWCGGGGWVRGATNLEWAKFLNSNPRFAFEIRTSSEERITYNHYNRYPLLGSRVSYSIQHVHNLSSAS